MLKIPHGLAPLGAGKIEQGRQRPFLLSKAIDEVEQGETNDNAAGTPPQA
jgi:hypothetical protein